MLVLCSRVLEPLLAAAAGYEVLENWHAAAQAQHLVACTADAAGLLEERDAAAAAFQRLERLAAAGV
jgi:hypothetical protein